MIGDGGKSEERRAEAESLLAVIWSHLLTLLPSHPDWLHRLLLTTCWVSAPFLSSVICNLLSPLHDPLTFAHLLLLPFRRKHTQFIFISLFPILSWFCLWVRWFLPPALWLVFFQLHMEYSLNLCFLNFIMRALFSGWMLEGLVQNNGPWDSFPQVSVCLNKSTPGVALLGYVVLSQALCFHFFQLLIRNYFLHCS